MDKLNLLVIEAHSDDSAISAAGLLRKFSSRYSINFALVCASGLHFQHAGFVSREERLKEYAKYVAAMGGVWVRDAIEPFDDEGVLDQVPRRNIVARIENVIQRVEPELIIFQGPSFHHDHTAVYEAVVAATRPTARFLPREMLVMENPTYVHSLGPSTDFKPDTYMVLSEDDVALKLETFAAAFPTQVRPGANCLSPEGIFAWARYRGIECRAEYAEAYRTFLRRIYE